MPMDVSKANGIGVSNNEDDTYPTIGTPSLLLWRHQARLERITNCNKEREKAEQRKEEIQPRLEAIKKKVSTKIANKLFGKLSKEKRSLCAELEKIDKKLTDVEKDYHNLESEVNVEEWLRNEQENVSSLCKEKQDSSKTTEEESRRVADYLRKHEMELKGYGTLRGFERSKTFLLKHPLLCNELAVNFLAIECLNLTIQGRTPDMAEQCIIIHLLLEMARSHNAVAANASVISAFFKNITENVAYRTELFDKIRAFWGIIVQRRRQYFSQKDDKDRLESIKQSPGKGSPQEAHESEKREAFDSSKRSKQQEGADKVDREAVICNLQQ